MDAEHTQYLITHQLNLSERFKITSNIYYNGFKRNWYKLDDIVEFFNENLDILEINKNAKSKKLEKDINTKMIWEELKDKKND